MDFPPYLQSLSATSDGSLFYAVHENFQFGLNPPWTPFEPNRTHVYKLDTSLNVLCEHILDGSVDNTYYFLNRIKATDDGGFILLGARRNLDDPSGYFEAWAQKFAASDCSVGLAEEQRTRQVVLFPNPGREGFTIVFNGETWSGDLELFDATGRLVSTTPIRTGQAQVRTYATAAGVYAYRALDKAGRVLATGRWVKE